MLTMRRITFYNVIDLFVEIDFSLPLSLSLPPPDPLPLCSGFSVSTVNRIHVFKPVSVQAMW